MKIAQEYMPQVHHILNVVGAVARYMTAEETDLDDEIDVRLTPESKNPEWGIQITGVAECQIAENFYNPDGEIESIMMAAKHRDRTYENPGCAAEALIWMIRDREIIELANEAVPITISDEAAAHAMETCTRVDDDDDGSERQVKAENAFRDAIMKRLTPRQKVELMEWALEDTIVENINHALELAGIKHTVN